MSAGRLAGKVALITGASRGIGAAVAERRERTEFGGIANQDVEPAIAVEERCRELVDLDEIAQIDGDEGGAAADGTDGVVDFLETAHRPRREDDMSALARKALGDGCTDAARGAGDQCDFVGEATGARR